MLQHCCAVFVDVVCLSYNQAAIGYNRPESQGLHRLPSRNAEAQIYRTRRNEGKNGLQALASAGICCRFKITLTSDEDVVEATPLNV